MGLLNVVFVCTVLLVGTAIAGLLPLLLKASSHETEWLGNWMTAVAAGFMLGSCLAIVLPEGFAALYGAEGDQEGESHGQNSNAGRILVSRKTFGDISPSRDHLRYSSPYDIFQDDVESLYNNHLQHQHEVSGEPFAGPVILAGFLLMMAFDVWHDSAYSEPGRQRGHLRHSGTLTDKESDPAAVVLGLLIHSAADGLALGVASASPSETLSAFVGLAMVLHKGPVSFGLGAFLVGKRVDNVTIITDMLMFAAATPLVTMAVYWMLVIGSTRFAFMQSRAFSALAILFSAGTFLYAATLDMLPDDLDETTLSVVVAGAAVPCLLSLVTAHHHQM